MMRLRPAPFLVLLLTGLIPRFCLGDEKYERPAYWLSHGYTEIHRPAIRHGHREQPKWAPHSLAWPIEFEDSAHSIGNSMAEFQSYGDGPYYHGGCDLRVRRGAPVHTPVAGRIEAGHYGYSNNPDGSSTKYWQSWPQGGDSHYFEVAVVTEDGFRFEFHHMDETRISAEVLSALKSGSGRVAGGALLGNTIPWPDGEYHHTHYNVITASGIQLNPEYYSPLLTDRKAPEVASVLASLRSGSTLEFGDGRFSEAPRFFAMAVIDHQDSNVYDHPPVLAGIKFDGGQGFAWDFRERLIGPNEQFPPIWEFFVESIQSPDGQSFATDGGYGQGASVIRIPVPSGAQGAFTLEVADVAGNSTRFSGKIGQ